VSDRSVRPHTDEPPTTRFSPPLPKLLPDLDKFLHRSRARNTVIDHTAPGVGGLVGVANSVETEAREAILQFFEVVPGHDFVVASLRTSSHAGGIVSCSLFVRLRELLRAAVPGVKRWSYMQRRRASQHQEYGAGGLARQWRAPLPPLPTPRLVLYPQGRLIILLRFIVHSLLEGLARSS